jgi:hypothetical protein
MFVGALHQGLAATGVGQPPRDIGELGEVGDSPFESLHPSAEVNWACQVVALVAIAAIGEHKVLDRIVGPS